MLQTIYKKSNKTGNENICIDYFGVLFFLVGFVRSEQTTAATV